MCIFMLQGMIHFSFFIFKFKCSQFQQLLFHLIEHFQVNSSYATHTSFLLQNQLKHPLTCCIYQHTPFLSPSCLPGLSDFQRSSNQRIVRSQTEWLIQNLNKCLHKNFKYFTSNIKFGTYSENSFSWFCPGSQKKLLDDF